MMKFLIACISVLFVCLFTHCVPKEQSLPIISVTIAPQQFFAERIAGDKFDIHLVVPPGSSPESYDPTPASLIKISNSLAYFRIGTIGFEMAWMSRLMETNADMKVYNNSEAITPIHSDEACCANHQGSHEGVDPHTWTTPKSAKLIAKSMLDAFIELDPANEHYYRSNFDSLRHDIEAVNISMKALLEDLKCRSFAIYHPSLTYFAEEFNLTQYALENQGKEPSAKSLKDLIDALKEEEVKIVFIQQEFDVKNAQLLAQEIGGKIVQINPLSYNWCEEMIVVAKAMYEQ